MSPWWRPVLVLVLVATPAMAAAQVSPTSPPHPSMPWSGITTPQGQFIRFIYYPAQPVTIEYLVPATGEAPAPESPPAEGETKAEDKPAGAAEPAPAESAPPASQVVRQVVMIPGYAVRETTIGFEYPERWTLEQVGPGAYRWRLLPAQLIRR